MALWSATPAQVRLPACKGKPHSSIVYLRWSCLPAQGSIKYNLVLLTFTGRDLLCPKCIAIDPPMPRPPAAHRLLLLSDWSFGWLAPQVLDARPSGAVYDIPYYPVQIMLWSRQMFVFAGTGLLAIGACPRWATLPGLRRIPGMLLIHDVFGNVNTAGPWHVCCCDVWWQKYKTWFLK